MTQLIIEIKIKSRTVIRPYFVFRFYNVENDEKIHVQNGETIKVKRGCYTIKDIFKFLPEKVNMTL